MEKVTIDDFIESLQIKIPPKEEFLKLSKKTAIYPESPTGYILNYERGILLYCLIAKHKPKTVLEIGTARGYSTLCMNWAMVEHHIPGRIFTIDPNRIDRKFDTAKNDKLESEFSTISELWTEIDPKWTDRIEPIAGYSGEVMNKYKFPKIEFAYIDGWHIYEAVRHDFFSILNSTTENCNVLFDDYFETTPIDGVKKFTDEFLVKNFDVLFIETNYKKQIEKSTNQYNYPQFMCYLQINRQNINSMKINESEVQRILDEYRKFESRWKIRQKINKKIPFLEKIKFSQFGH